MLIKVFFWPYEVFFGPINVTFVNVKGICSTQNVKEINNYVSCLVTLDNCSVWECHLLPFQIRCNRVSEG